MMINLSAWRQKGLTGYPFDSELTNCSRGVYTDAYRCNAVDICLSGDGSQLVSARNKAVKMNYY